MKVVNSKCRSCLFYRNRCDGTTPQKDFACRVVGKQGSPTNQTNDDFKRVQKEPGFDFLKKEVL